MENLSPKNVIPRAGKERRYDGHGERLEALSLRGVFSSWKETRLAPFLVQTKKVEVLERAEYVCAFVHTCAHLSESGI